tara:strand:- start:127 stop:918 length:792 start_codon:yes stop_codon:yes gene_type:complete
MSFEKFMDDWAKGKRSIEVTKDAFYEIRTTTNSLQECEVLQRGTEAFEDTALTINHICWLRDQESKIRCCYFIESSYREMNFKQLDLIFGDEIRNGGLESNRQLLSNGIEVPIVPEFFIEEVRTKHEQKRRRVLYAQKIKKKNIREMNAMLWFFNMRSAPTNEECFESIHIIPPNIFTRKTTREEVDENLPQRERTIQIFEKTRTRILKHPLYAEKLKNTVLDNVDSVSDLLKLQIEDSNGAKINIAPHLIALYHILFPLKIK